ncbi:hypothetical protein [Micromonospora avicenniae]|uniref:hypothetical protein n=1 Tax=Micromonospora avicenniae TaxID=1198245 RepID=UPI003331487F
MWNTAELHQVKETRTIVINNGQVDVTATLYRFGVTADRIAWANTMLSAAGLLMVSAVADIIDADAKNSLRNQATELAERAVWMASGDPENPDRTSVDVKVDGRWYEAEGWGPDDYVRTMCGHEFNYRDVQHIRPSQDG